MITILVILLGVLIFRFGMNRFGMLESKNQEGAEYKQVIQIMSDMENQVAYERYLEDASVQSQDNRGQLPNRTTEQIGVETNDKLPEYSKLYPDLYVEKITPEVTNVDQKVAYLSFDDGPSRNTLKILEILKQKGAVATFFIIGSTMTPEGEQALKQMLEDGCAIGIHTYSHKKEKIYSSVDQYLNDFYKVYTQIYEITGEHVNIFRFPWGSYNRYSKAIKDDLISEMGRRGFTYYDWNVSAEDSVGTPTPSSIMKNILKDVTKYNDPVILMHDSSVNDLTVEMLPSIIDKLIELGYTFDTLNHREPCQFCY